MKSRHENLEDSVAVIHFAYSSTFFTKKPSNKRCSYTNQIKKDVHTGQLGKKIMYFRKCSF